MSRRDTIANEMIILQRSFTKRKKQWARENMLEKLREDWIIILKTKMRLIDRDRLRE